jgi:hypothetical protein
MKKSLFLLTSGLLRKMIIKTKFISAAVVKNASFVILFLGLFGCKKDNTSIERSLSIKEEANKTSKAENKSQTVNYNLEVVLRGEGNRSGHIHFRQDKDAKKIITLDIKVHHLEPNHEYLLQRAVDGILDGNCTSTAWLTLGKGLTPQPVITDDKGNATEELWRDITTIPSGSTFDIHFRVIEAVSSVIVLTSDCYQYTVR